MCVSVRSQLCQPWSPGVRMRALLEPVVVVLCPPNRHTRGAQQGQILPVTGEGVKQCPG